jgi:T5SS/PEP-CTERM-associated repeat protein
VLTGSSSLTTSISTDWLGGDLDGSGVINIAGTFNIDSANHGFAGFTLNIGSLATANWSNYDIHSVDNEGGVINNAGTFNDSASESWYWFVTQTPTFNNLTGANFIKTGDTGVMQEIQAVFNNAGTMDIRSGDLLLDGGGTSGGTFLVAANSNLLLRDFNEATPGAGSPTTTFTSSSVIRSLGGVWFSRFSTTDPAYDMSTTAISGKYDSAFTVIDCGPDGSVTFKPGALVSTDNSIGLTNWYLYSGKAVFNTAQAPYVGMNAVVLDGGDLGGADAIVVWGDFHWSSGTLSGSGSHATYTESTATLDGVDKFLLNRNFVSQGSASTAWTAGDIHLNNSAIFNDTTSTWNTNFDGTIVNDNPSLGSSFNNYGTFVKSAGNGATGFVNVAFNNTGTVLLQSGSLRLNGGGTDSGTFLLSSGTIFELSAGSGQFHTLTNTSKIIGSSAWLRLVDTTVFAAGSINVNAFDIEDSTLNLSSAATSYNGVIGPGLGTAGQVNVGAGGSWNPTSYVQVGASGAGTLAISNGGKVVTGVIDSAVFDATSSGYLSVDGATSSLSGTSYARIANLGSAAMNITNGALVSNTDGIIASESGANGTVSVSGSGSRWINNGYLAVGFHGNGSLSITGGGTVSSTSGHIASESGGVGSVLVSGTGSAWTMGSFLSVGGLHDGTLSILAGGSVSSTQAYVGDSASGHGHVHVGGSGSQWKSSDLTVIGNLGNGSLIVDTGAHATATGSGYIGFGTGALGSATITGAGSRWDTSQQMAVGIYGAGSLYISDGAVVTSKKSTSATGSGGIIGRFATGSGTVTVFGAGSRWDMAGIGDDGHLNVGEGSISASDTPGGTGVLNVLHGGIVTSVNGYVGRAGGGKGTVTVADPGSAWNMTGSLFVGGDDFTAAPGGAGTVIINNGTVAASVSTKVWNNGAIYYVGGTFTTGTLSVVGGGLVQLSPADSTASVLQTKAISVDSSSKLDLSNNKAIVDYTTPTPSPADSIRQQIRTAYNNGAWNGHGITTNTGDATHGLGYADNSVLGLSNFGGIAVDSSSVLIKYTFLGDSNLDGQVDLRDLYALASNYKTAGKLWSSGDFNYDGTVDVKDLTLLARNWQAGVNAPLGPALDTMLASLGLPQVSVPEPGAIGAVGLALLGALPRRSRRRSR